MPITALDLREVVNVAHLLDFSEQGFVNSLLFDVTILRTGFDAGATLDQKFDSGA